MELSDFIADGRTKYELNGIRFVVETVNFEIGYIGIRTGYAIGGGSDLRAIHSKYSNIKGLSSYIEDIKLATTCGQCGKVESRKVVDIHQNENGSFSVSGVVNVCEHDEIVYTSNQYVEAIEKEVPELKDVRNKYDVQIVGKDGVKTYVDVYRVMTAFNVKNAALQHANKKILKAGERGHKDYVQDLKEAIASIELAILEWEQTNV